MNSRLKIDNSTIIDQHRILMMNPAALKNDINDAISLALIDIKKLSSLKVFLYMLTACEEILSIRDHQQKCEKKFNIDRNTFLEGIADLYRIGYLRLNQDVYELMQKDVL